MKEIFIKDLILDKTDKIKCWIASFRKTKNVFFFVAYDSTGKMDCIADNNTKNYLELTKLARETCVELSGKLVTHNGAQEFYVESFEVLAKSSLKISPYPNQEGFDVLNEKHSKNIVIHPTYYIRNRKLADIFYIKAIFKREIQNYLWNKGFIEFEAPTLTKQTLYDDSGAIWLEQRGEKLSLSRCATFHLEPAIVAYEKLFTITNSHADERVRSNRHLIEYLHLKAEMAFVNLEELIEFAKNLYYEVALKTYEKCKEKIDAITTEKVIAERLEKLNPKHHKLITYDKAVELIKSKGIDFEYGKSLSTKHEQIITEHFGENFVWVKYIPYNVEGFMFKRKSDNHFLTMTCDLIAPKGFGEILGCAEKMTDYDEVISSMKERNKFKDFARYEDYVNLHKLGLPEHGGIGMGIERAVRYLLGLNHVKYLKPFAVITTGQINH